MKANDVHGERKLDQDIVDNHDLSPYTAASRHSGGAADPQDWLRHRQEFGIKFDLEQPWQRSLLKELQHMQEAADASTSTSGPLVPRGDRLLLGHAESGDFALVLESDEVSVNTDATSTLPTRVQVVHRDMSRVERSLLSVDDDEDHDGAPKAETKDNQLIGIEPGAPMISREFGCSSESQHTKGFSSDQRDEKSVDDRIGDGSKTRKEKKALSLPASRPIPDMLPGRGNFKKMRRAPPQQSVRSSEHSGNEEESHSTNFTSSAAGNSCFCMGANILDFWIPPVSADNLPTTVLPSGRFSKLESVQENYVFDH